MKILFDNQIFCAQRFGGVSRYHIELAKQLKQQFGDIVDIPIWCIRNTYLADYTNKPMYDVKNKYVTKLLNRGNTVNTILNVCFRPYDIVHLTWYDSAVVNACRNQKVVITIHDMIQEIFQLDPITVKRKKEAIYSADGIISISENTKKDILRLYPDVPEEKIQVIYHGTNHLKKPLVPEGFSLPKKYVLYVGARGAYKNAEILMKSLTPKILKEYDLYLLFIGGGAFSEEEKCLLDELGIGDRTLQQNVSDAELAYIYQNAECFVYPSLYEGFGFPILEAFDNNCPVICSNTSSLPEVGGEAVLYFAPNNSNELTEKILSLLSDAALREQYIKRGEARVKEFTWEKTAQQTRAFYHKIQKQ